MSEGLVFLVWLEWPEKCFRLDAEALRSLQQAVGENGRVVRVKSERMFLELLPQATQVLTWNFKAEWYARAKKLHLVATPAAGREFIAPPPTGISNPRLHFGHFHGKYIAESVAGFMLGWARGFFAVRHSPMNCRDWPRTWLSDRCFEVSGTKAVIIGYGHVGRAIGRMLDRLGVEVVGVTRHGIYQRRTKSADATADRFLRAADWLILALPSTTGTDDCLDATLIRKLPRRCVVINVGRGNAIDERALYRALESGRIAGAYLDVRKHEPSATVLEAPGYVPELGGLENCVIMPHASAFSNHYLLTCIKELVDDGCL